MYVASYRIIVLHNIIMTWEYYTTSLISGFSVHHEDLERSTQMYLQSVQLLLGDFTSIVKLDDIKKVCNFKKGNKVKKYANKLMIKKP